MSIINVLICSTAFTTNLFNLTDLYIQISQIIPYTSIPIEYKQSELFDIDELNKIDINNGNKCYEATYFLYAKPETPTLETTTPETTTPILDIVTAIRSIILINIIFGIGFLLSIIFFSSAYKTMKDSFPDNIEDYIAYEDKYDKEFYTLNIEPLTITQIDKLKEVYIEDHSPSGKIVMYYDFATDTFNYYIDNKNAITYYELEAVAKLFAIKNNCRSLFIEETTLHQEKRQEKRQEERQEKREEKRQEKGQDEDPSVFVTVKKYNNTRASRGKDERNKIDAIKNNAGTKENLRNNIDEFDKIKKQGNHFKHVGKITDFEADIESENMRKSNLNINIEVNRESKFDDGSIVKLIRQEVSQQEVSQQEVSQQEVSQQEVSQQELSQQELTQQELSQPHNKYPLGKLLKKTSSKIMPKNDMSFAEYKRLVLNPNHKQ